jgi:hypothetical protein
MGYTKHQEEKSKLIRQVFALKRKLDWDWKQFNYFVIKVKNIRGKIVDMEVHNLINIVKGLEVEMVLKKNAEATAEDSF